MRKDQSVDIENEIVEACLSTFENLIKKCPKEIGPYIKDILAMSKSLISYDPNYTYNDEDDHQMDDGDDEGGWGSEFEDDERGNDDDDDTSWKVRRGALKII